MRYVFLLLVCINTALASIIPSGPALVERVTSGGYVPEAMQGWSEKISIFSTGEVFLSFKQNQITPWEHKLVANLSVDILNTLNHVVTNAQAGELEFTDEPGCTDAPVTTYSVTKAGGENIIFAKNIACKMGYSPFYNSYALQSILDGFGAFSYLDVE